MGNWLFWILKWKKFGLPQIWVSLNRGCLQAVDTCGQLSKPYKLRVWKPNLVSEYFSTITYHSNLNYDRLVFETTHLDGLDNCPQVSTACGHPRFSQGSRGQDLSGYVRILGSNVRTKWNFQKCQDSDRKVENVRIL